MMRTFLYSAALQWKLDVRNKEILVLYYIVPLVFFLFMGGIFTAIIPNAYQTLIQSMTVFGVTMGAVLGAPTPLVELYGSDIKKAYRVGGIPLWTAAACNFISVFLHLMLMSLVIFFAAPVIFKATVPNNLPLYFTALALCIAANVCIGTLLGLFVKNSAKLTMISQFIFLPSILLSGIMFPAMMLPKAIAYLGRLFPATWGYGLMCADAWRWENLLPLPCIILATLIVCAVKLRKMKRD